MKMRLVGFLVFTVLISTLGSSQDIQPVSKKLERQDMLMVQYQYDGLSQFPDSIKYSPWSRGGGVQLMYDHFLSRNGNFSVGVGVGIASHNFFSKAVFPTAIDSNGVTYGRVITINDPDTVKKNKLATNFIDFPVEFRYRTNPNAKGHSWKIAVGARIGYRTNIFSKTVLDNGNKYKSFIYPAVSRSRYGLTGRVGYGKVSVFGYYSLGNLFYEGRGTELTPYSIGINLTLF